MHIVSLFTILFLINSFAYAMNENNAYTVLPSNTISHIAGYCDPIEKNTLMRVCKNFCVCLKNRKLIMQANPYTIHAKDKLRGMFRAAFDGDHIMVDLLLSAGANPDCHGWLGITPLFVSAQEGRVDVVKSLLKARADIHIKTQVGDTPLHVAVHRNRVHVVKLLLTAGANIHEKDKTGTTPQSIARHNGYVQIVKLMQEQVQCEELERRKAYMAKRKTW
jgi:hypothetical protein